MHSGWVLVLAFFVGLFFAPLFYRKNTGFALELSLNNVAVIIEPLKRLREFAAQGVRLDVELEDEKVVRALAQKSEVLDLADVDVDGLGAFGAHSGVGALLIVVERAELASCR